MFKCVICHFACSPRGRTWRDRNLHGNERRSPWAPGVSAVRKTHISALKPVQTPGTSTHGASCRPLQCLWEVGEEQVCDARPSAPPAQSAPALGTDYLLHLRVIATEYGYCCWTLFYLFWLFEMYFIAVLCFAYSGYSKCNFKYRTYYILTL